MTVHLIVEYVSFCPIGYMVGIKTYNTRWKRLMVALAPFPLLELFDSYHDVIACLPFSNMTVSITTYRPMV